MFSFFTSLIPSSTWGYIKIIGTTLIIAGIIGAGWYINSLRNKVDELQLNNEILTMSYSQLQMNIDSLEQDIVIIKDINSNFINIQNQNKEAISKLEDKFSQTKTGNDRDLGKLAEQKPKLIQNAINNGTAKVNRCFELITGAELQEGETNETIQNCREN